MKKIAVVLFNLGGPDSLEAVQPFLFNLFNDKAIIGAPQPFRWIIAKLISSRRARIAREIYSALGGKSPLLENTQVQAEALEQTLRASRPNDEIRCFIAMRYWHPMADQTSALVRDWGADSVVLLPLYPQYSVTTTSSSFRDWHRASASAGLSADIHAICCYPKSLKFTGAVADRLREEINATEDIDSVRVIFSAHGLPKKVVDSGDPYKWGIEQTAAMVINATGVDGLDWVIAYQSRVGPFEWIKPYTDDEIRRAGEANKRLILVPIAFVSEHSETLVELDIEYRELARKSGVPGYKRVGTVGDDDSFIAGLRLLVDDALSREPGLHGPDGKHICPSFCTKCPLLEL